MDIDFNKENKEINENLHHVKGNDAGNKNNYSKDAGKNVDNADLLNGSNPEKTNDFVRRLSMDKSGNIRKAGTQTGILALGTHTRTFIILGWISAALTAFVSPLFAVSGIVFGALANRTAKQSGSMIIITNIVLALINLFFGLFLVVAMRRMMFGY